MKPEQLKFMLDLKSYDGVASSEDLGPQMSQADNAARQTCKRRGWAVFYGGYWRLTPAGWAALGEPKE